MSNRADGSIVIDTKLDNSGFSRGSREMESAISSLQRQVGSMSKRMDYYFTAMQKSMNATARSAQEQTQAQQQAQAQMQQQAQAQAQAQAQVQQAQERTTTFSEMLKNAFSSATNAAVRFSGSSSGAFGAVVQFGSRAVSAVRPVVQVLGRVALAAVKVQASLVKIVGSSVVEGLRSIAGRASEVAERILGISRAVSKTKGPLQAGLWNLIKYGLGVRSVFALVNRIRSAIKEGFSNLAQFSAPVNEAIESVKSALGQLKNALATALAPVFTAVAPAIVYLCNLLSTALGYIAQFMSALTGGKTYIKASNGVQGVAKSLGSAGKAAKEANRQLAEFDKLNILTDNSKDSGGGGAGGAGDGAGIGFEEVPIESAISDFIQRIKDAFAAGDYEEIGRILAEGINKAVQKLRDFISWDNVHAFWEHWIDVFCRIFNSLVKNIDWYNIGATIGEGLNTLLHICHLLLTGIDWKQLGVALGTALNGLVDYFDWKLFGQVLGERFQAGLDFLYGAVTTFDWAKLGTSIGDSINSYISAINWKEVGETLSAGARGILRVFINAIEQTDWGQIGRAVADILGSIDWGGIIHDVFEGLGAINGAIDAFLGGLIADALTGAVEYFQGKAEECGGNIVLGVLKGIGDAIVGIGKWIIDNIFAPFFKGFEDAFGISSPAKEMEPIGEYIWAGVLNGIVNSVKGIKKWVKRNILSPLYKALSGGGSGKKLELEATVNFVKKTGQTLGKLIGTAVTAVVTFLKKTGQNLEKLIGTAVTAVVTFMKKTGQSLEKLIGTACTAVVTFMKKTGQNLEKLIGTACKAVVTFSKKTGQSLEKLIGTACKAVVSFSKKTGQSLEKLIGTACKAVVSFSKKTGQSLEKLIGTACTAVVTFQKKTGQTLNELIGKACTAVVTFMKKTGQTLNGLIGKVCTATVNFVKQTGQTLNSLIGSVCTATVNFVAGAGAKLRELLGLAGGGVIIDDAIHVFGSGGVITGARATWWDNVQKYGSGTNRAHGTAFIAGEAGPEIVGHVNGRTEVLNRSQIADAIYHAVLSAISGTVSALAGYVGDRLTACANGIISTLYTVTSTVHSMPVTIDGISEADISRMLIALSDLPAWCYTAPVISTGAVLPYSVAAGVASEPRKAGIDENDLDELGQTLVSAMGSAVMAIVTAIQHSERSGSAMDLSGITQRTIDDINRRTRMYSASPIV